MAWSYSRLTTYEKCPKKFKYKIDRVREAPSPAMERGSRIHKDAEEFLKGKHKKVPATLLAFEPELKELRKLEAVPEEQIAVTSAWQRVEWFSPEAWLRIVIDARHLIPARQSTKVIDFKTGRMYQEHLDQLELYSLVFFRLGRGTLREVEGELWYIDHTEIVHHTFGESEVDDFEFRWRERIDPMLKAKEYPPTPGSHCRWCGFAASKGGPCRDEA